MLKYLLRRKSEISFDLFIEFLAWALIGGIVFLYYEYFDVFNNFINNITDKFRGLIIIIFSLFSYWAITLLKKILNKLNNLLEEELPIIVSDVNTIFEKSSITELIGHTTSKIATKHPSWQEKDVEYSKELRDSQWIAHTEFSNPREIIGNGTFVFLKEFEIPENIIELKTCDLNFLVDDTCTIVINEKTLTDNISGKKELHYFYIKDYLKKGKNEIRFHVNNENSNTAIKLITKDDKIFRLTEKDLSSSNQLEMSNWYGIKFCIRITCIRN